MSNPIYPDLSTETADALSGTTDAATGIAHLAKEASGATTPTLYKRMMQQMAHVFDALSRFGGRTITLTGLNVGVFACHYRIGAAEKFFAGVASQALTPSATNYLYLDADETLKISTSAWPGGDHFRLAKVTTNGSAVTGFTDARLHNFQIGIVNDWASVNASGDVNMNNFALANVAGLRFKAATELTLASDTITPTQYAHTVDTQSDAAGDDLVTLTADAAKIGRMVILGAENAARVVTVKSTGNIKLKDGDYALDDADKIIILQQYNATHWREWTRNFNSPGTLQRHVDANDKSISNIRRLNLKEGPALEIIGGEITITHSRHALVTEGSAPADELVTINGGTIGDLLILSPDFPASFTIKDAFSAGGDNIILSVPGRDLVLNSQTEKLSLYFNGSTWEEIARGRWALSMLAGTGQVLPYSPALFRAGALSNGHLVADFDAAMPFRLRRAKGRVGTAPMGGSCVVMIRKNGANVFASDAAAINIADGTTTDTSDLIDVSFSTGDRCTVIVTTANSAADVGVSLEAYMEAATQP